MTASAYIDPEGIGADFKLPIFQGGQGGPFGFGCQALGDADSQASKQGTYQWYDAMSKVVKSHAIKWGAEVRDVYSNNNTNFSSRALSPSTFSPPTAFPRCRTSRTGVDSNELEDTVGALLGLVNSQGANPILRPRK